MKKLSNVRGEVLVILVMMVATGFFLAGQARREEAMIRQAETFQDQYEANRLNRFFSKVDRYVVTDYRILHGDQYRMTVVDQADSNTFQVYDPNPNDSRYAHDQNHVFYLENLVVDADPASFLPLDSSYARDQDQVFYQGHELKGVDVGTFEVLKEGYAKDKNSVYYLDQVLKDADLVSFYVNEFGYALDAKHVFVREKMIEGSDPATLVMNEKSGIISDKTRVYNGPQEVDPETYVTLACGYAKDKSRAYYVDKNVEQVDIASFEQLGRNGTNSYARDKNHLYVNGEVSSENPDTFKFEKQSCG